MYSLAVAFLLTSSAFANEEEHRRLNWPSSFGCSNNYDCKQIGDYCYTGWLGINYCAAGNAVGSRCSTSHDCGYIGNRALNCISGVCYDYSPSPSPSPSPGGCTSSEQCPNIGEFCYGEFSLRNGVCKQGNGLGSMCKRDSSCGYIGNRPVSCVNGICIDSGRRLSDNALPRVEPLQPEDDTERRRAGDDVQPGYAPPPGSNCNYNYDCSGIGNYCYFGNPYNFCSYGSPIGSLCQSSYDCGYQGYTPLTCKWGQCRRPHHPSPSPSPSPSGRCSSSEDCSRIGDFCYGEYSNTNGVCKPGNGLGSMCREDSSCGYIGNRPVSCVSGICIDSGSSGIVYGRRLDNAQPSAPSAQPGASAQPADNAKPSAQPADNAQPTAQPKAQSGFQGRFAPPKGFKCESAHDCYRGQECVVAKPFNYCKWIRGRRADDLEQFPPSAGEIVAYPPPPGLKCNTSADCKREPWKPREYCFAGYPYNYCQAKNPIGAICTPGKTGECGVGYCSSRTLTCKAGVRRLQEAEESS